MKFLPLTVLMIWSTTHANTLEPLPIISKSIIENENNITLIEPYTVHNDALYRFSRNRQTYEGLCKVVLNQDKLSIEKRQIASKGTISLSADGAFKRLGPISNSLHFIKCFK